MPVSLAGVSVACPLSFAQALQPLSAGRAVRGRPLPEIFFLSSHREQFEHMV